MSRRKEPVIPADLLDQLLAGSDAATALDQGGLLDSLKKALAERALNAEMDHHLGGDDQGGNNRNGYGRKTVVTDTGKIAIDVPRDRQGGSVRISVCERAVEHYAAMALMKRSPKMTANWALAMDHSRGGIFHSFSERFKIR